MLVRFPRRPELGPPLTEAAAMGVFGVLLPFIAIQLVVLFALLFWLQLAMWLVG
ncbi:hypothetical protein MKP05_12845 [Halomonas sp. EGI 63088]|uniref:Uncharacterized protein n=1 Tax=Halomonas flagellata TaxID=2920385 RepID=A0ABS9RW01_9GAMM|nr:hypothetical protein [Halomonas flagellata]MCH4564009.1 hypothetical protein [Halomonas flagellata]